MIKNYETSSFTYWFVWVFAVVFSALLLLYFIIPINNVNVPHTWFLNPATPGATLTSYRMGFVSVSIRIGIIAGLVALAAIFFMIGYRKSFVPFAVFILCMIFWFFTYTVLSDQYAHCNGQGQFGNLCNSKKLCCVHEILVNPANHCPTAIDCPTPVLLEDVEPDAQFMWLYWLHFGILILGIFWVIASFAIYYSKEPAGTKESEEPEEPEKSEESKPLVPVPSEPIIPTKSSLISGLAPIRKTHILRQRKK
jgi:hypothetical protein